MNEVVIDIKNISKVYSLYKKHIDRLKEAFHPFGKKYHSDFYALNDISFELRKGDTLGLIGKNGSGKSTLLKIITGVVKESSGSFKVNGTISSILELGVGFNPELNGEENIFFNSLFQEQSKKELKNKMKEIIDFADIGEYISQPIKTYSSGMLARLAFSCAISIDPQILIVDEALAVGDAQFVRKCFTKFEELREKKITILFVSHSQEAVLQFCNRGILLEKGKLVIDSTPSEAFNLYNKLITEEAREKISPPTEKKVNISSSQIIQKKDVINGLDKIAEQFGNYHAEVIDIGFFDEEKQAINILNSRKKYFLFYKIIFNEDVEDYSIGVHIRNLAGLVIYYTTTYILGIKLNSMKKNQVLFVEIEVELNLASGDYFLYTGVNNKDDSFCYHGVINAYKFSIVNDEKNDFGLINLKVTEKDFNLKIT